MAKVKTPDRNLPATPPAGAPAVPWNERSKGERLSEVADMSLAHARRVLAIELDPSDLSPGNLKLLSIVTTTALAVLSTQVKVDTEKMRTIRERGGGTLEEFYRARDAASEEGSS